MRDNLACCSILFLLACSSDVPRPGFEGVGGTGSSTQTAAAVTNQASSVASSKSATTVTAQAGSTSSTGKACPDPANEPNEDEEQAIDLGTISACDDTGSSVMGTLVGKQDVDWFRYYATDTTLCMVDPARVLTAGFPIRVCKFIQCDAGESADFECPAGSTPEMSPDLRPGCCSMSGLNIDLTCGSSSFDNDNANIYIRIDNPEDYECVPYQFSYHY